jgi:hypothetical protein
MAPMGQCVEILNVKQAVGCAIYFLAEVSKKLVNGRELVNISMP